jgi:hypothetical protein
LHPSSRAGAGDGDDDAGEGDDVDEALQAALEKQQQASLEEYGKDIREMDEIFEIIAQVRSRRRAPGGGARAVPSAP